MASQDCAGLIGTGFLQRFTVVFDSPGKRILLTPNRRYEDRAEYDESGLRIRADGPDFHRFVVTRIVPESPATKAGIRSGDIIVSIDNHPTQELTLTEIRSMFRRPNAHCTIGIIRGDGQLRIAIQLRALL
jgi:C-terminal processing protease CtpA/Prc